MRPTLPECWAAALNDPGCRGPYDAKPCRAKSCNPKDWQDIMSFKESCDAFRLQYGMTMEDVATALGTSRVTLYRWAGGYSSKRTGKVSEAMDMALASGMSAEEAVLNIQATMAEATRKRPNGNPGVRDWKRSAASPITSMDIDVVRPSESFLLDGISLLKSSQHGVVEMPKVSQSELAAAASKADTLRAFRLMVMGAGVDFATGTALLSLFEGFQEQAAGNKAGAVGHFQMAEDCIRSLIKQASQ